MLSPIFPIRSRATQECPGTHTHTLSLLGVRVSTMSWTGPFDHLHPSLRFFERRPAGRNTSSVPMIFSARLHKPALIERPPLRGTRQRHGTSRSTHISAQATPGLHRLEGSTRVEHARASLHVPAQHGLVSTKSGRAPAKFQADSATFRVSSTKSGQVRLSFGRLGQNLC